MLRSVFGKVVHDQWRMVLGWAAFAGIWPAMYVALYPSIGALGELEKMLDEFPPAIREFFASSSLNLSTPEGFLNMELFTFVAPLLVLAYTVVVCGGATAGEEEKGTLDLLLANPVPRWRIIVEKSAAFVIGTVVIGIGMWIGAALGALAVNIDLDMWLGGRGAAAADLAVLPVHRQRPAQQRPRSWQRPGPGRLGDHRRDRRGHRLRAPRPRSLGEPQLSWPRASPRPSARRCP